MSYILDALQRSERDRHQIEAPSIHSPGVHVATKVRAVWPWVAGAVLVLNLSVLILWSYKERSASQIPAAAEAITVSEQQPLGVATPEPAPLASQSQRPSYVSGSVVEISELPTRIQQALTTLHLSAHIHVSGKPRSGFVIINGAKLREGESQNDLIVEQIRRTELVLNYKGHRFRLPVAIE